MPFNLGPGELIVLAIFALLLFGPKKLPELGKALGESISAFKKAIYHQTDAAGPNDSTETVCPPAAPGGTVRSKADNTSSSPAADAADADEESAKE